jgi:hypothetical protein
MTSISSSDKHPKSTLKKPLCSHYPMADCKCTTKYEPFSYTLLPIIANIALQLQLCSSSSHRIFFTRNYNTDILLGLMQLQVTRP